MALVAPTAMCFDSHAEGMQIAVRHHATNQQAGAQ